MVDYQINPSLMGGKVKSISQDGMVKINLNGRLGIINIPADYIVNREQLQEGGRLRFFFSYIRVVDEFFEFDDADMNLEYGMQPTLISGKCTEVNDTAVELSIMNGKANITVPRRWMFTEKPLEPNLNCQMYLSCMEVIQ